MISPKLLVLLQSFSKYEMRAFHKFIQSPFHNENSDLIKLFEIIDKEFQHIGWDKNPNSNLKKDIVWKEIKGDRKYQDEQMRRMCSDLTKTIYSFIAISNFQKKPLSGVNHLLPKISNPKLQKHFSSIIRHVNNSLKKSEIRNSDYYLENLQIEHEKFKFLENSKSKIDSFINLESSDFYLDCYYINKKLKNFCDALAYGNVSAIKPEIQLFPEFLNFIKTKRFIQEPNIEIYHTTALMLLNPKDESLFQLLKNLLNKNGNIFPQPELKSLYIYLINYCIDTKINNGQTEYFRELFEIFKIVIEEEVFFNPKGILAPQDYKNIITVGLHVKEFEWTENFIQQYTNRLPKESQDNDLNYNLAKVYFHQEQYEKVIEQLREVEYKNLTYALGGKLMLLKTYYELDEMNPLSSLLELASLAPYDKKGIQKLKEQINNCKALAAKSWLLEKVAEME